MTTTGYQRRIKIIRRSAIVDQFVDECLIPRDLKPKSSDFMCNKSPGAVNTSKKCKNKCGDVNGAETVS